MTTETRIFPLTIPWFWRSPIWLGLQATKRLSRRILGAVPAVGNTVSHLAHRKWHSPTSDYYLRQFNRYWHHLETSGLDPHNAAVCEIGPGRTLDVSLMFALAGARDVVAVDYECWTSTEVSTERATGLAEQMPAYMECSDDEAESFRWRAATGNYQLRYEKGHAEHIALPAGSVDYMFSHSVLEHVMDLDGAFASMSRVLARDGVAVHHIDLKDHGVFRDKNPLLMLQFPDWLWTLCTKNAPDPINRARLGAYLSLGEKHGLEVQVLSRTVLAELPFPRRVLAREFRELPLDDLRTVAVEIACRHRGAES